MAEAEQAQPRQAGPLPARAGLVAPGVPLPAQSPVGVFGTPLVRERPKAGAIPTAPLVETGPGDAAVQPPLAWPAVHVTTEGGVVATVAAP